MRLASFRVNGPGGKQADVSVIPLPGLGGTDLSNVNRWRSQVGLPAITEEEMTKMAQPVPVAGQTAQLFDLAGTNPGSGDKSRILAALLHREGATWFFKMTGDDELVAGQKAAFIDFLKSLSFTAAAQPELPPSHPPIGGGSNMAQPMTMPAAGSNQPKSPKPEWQVPAGWQETPGGQFLVAKFIIAGDNNTQAAVNVSSSPGNGGGLAGNVNRWRGQLGLDQQSESDIANTVTTQEAPGGKISLVDLTGTDARTGKKSRLVGAVVPQADATWFYKIMGDEQIVEREKPAFVNFVKTVKY
jgi:hypothetical protein